MKHRIIGTLSFFLLLSSSIYSSQRIAGATMALGFNGLKTKLDSDGFSHNANSFINSGTYFYRIEIWGGGGPDTNLEILCNLGFNPRMAMGIGKSDDPDGKRRIAVSRDGSNYLNFDNRGATDLSDIINTGRFFAILNSKWGIEQDSHMILWISTTESSDSQIEYRIINTPSGLGSIRYIKFTLEKDTAGAGLPIRNNDVTGNLQLVVITKLTNVFSLSVDTLTVQISGPTNQTKTFPNVHFATPVVVDFNNIPAGKYIVVAKIAKTTARKEIVIGEGTNQFEILIQ